jgi:hypothetical protein
MPLLRADSRPAIRELMESYPDDRDDLVALADRLGRFSRACGCTEGAIAALSAMAVAAAYYVWPSSFPWPEHRLSVFWIPPFVLTAAGIGKTIGIVVARLRLELAYRQLHRRYHRGSHVHLHEVGRSGSHRV